MTKKRKENMEKLADTQEQVKENEKQLLEAKEAYYRYEVNDS
jgi:hypothetical protein